jgi:hypothetical protein
MSGFVSTTNRMLSVVNFRGLDRCSMTHAFVYITHFKINTHCPALVVQENQQNNYSMTYNIQSIGTFQ